jgi:hypothetical protein
VTGSPGTVVTRVISTSTLPPHAARRTSLEELGELARLGVHSVNVSLWASTETDLHAKLDAIQRFGDEIARPLREMHADG